MFGLSPGENDTCKRCSNLVEYQYQKKYYKCKHYGKTHSEASDWKLNQRGCGLFNQEYEGKEVIRLVRPEKCDQEEVISGQVSLFEYLQGGRR